jgi:hypothetical protein
MLDVGNPGVYLTGVPLLSSEVISLLAAMSARTDRSLSRSGLRPDIQTLPVFAFAFWYGFFGPRKGDFGDAASR